MIKESRKPQPFKRRVVVPVKQCRQPNPLKTKMGNVITQAPQWNFERAYSGWSGPTPLYIIAKIRYQ